MAAVGFFLLDIVDGLLQLGLRRLLRVSQPGERCSCVIRRAVTTHDDDDDVKRRKEKRKKIIYFYWSLEGANGQTGGE